MKRSAGSDDTELKLEAVADPGKIATLRHAAREYAEQHCPELAQDVALTVSELCTNVVLHAYRHGEPGPMRLRLRYEGDKLRGEVSDTGSGISPRLFDAGRGTGMGLWTVAQLTDEMHLGRRPSGGTVATFAWECR